MKMWMNKLAVVAIGAAAVALCHRPACAAETANVPATMTIQAVRSVSVTPTTLNFGTPSVDDFNAGFTGEQQLTATILANTTWGLYVTGNAATWNLNGKPRSDIKFKSSSGDQDTYAALDATGGKVYHGTATAGVNRVVTFKVALSFANDSPGTYTYNSVVVTVGADV
jgi:hypothetical protein